MKSVISFVLTCVVVITLCVVPADANKAQIIENYGKIPLSFTANQGQFDSQVKFTTRGSGCAMFFTSTGTTYLLSRETEESITHHAAQRSVVYPGDPENKINNPEYESYALKVKFLDANPDPAVTGENRLPGNSNYFIGNNSTKWQTDVANYEKVRLSNLYDGIDLVYYGNNSSVKYDFVVLPGEDYSRILLTYDLGENSSRALSVNEKGEMVVSTPLGDVIERKPYCYQRIDGEKVEVDIGYDIVDSELNRFGFRIGEYNPDYTLIIDPELVYSTLIGGSGTKNTRGIAVDSDGNAFIIGYTSSSDYPVTAGTSDETHNGGGYDAFISKINSTGTSLVYSTFIGGTGSDSALDFKIDDNGNAYLTGYVASSDFPVTSGAYDETFNEGGQDSYLLKLNSLGNGIIYSTYIGGTGSDTGYGVDLDPSGNVYVTGETNSTDFPTTSGAYNESSNGDTDCYVLKINTDGTTLLYATLIGGGSWEGSPSIDVDSSGNAYIAGTTNSTNFPVTTGAYDETNNGGYEVFATKLNATGSSLIYSTYFGGSGNDNGYKILLDASGNAYVSGSTISSNFPTTQGAFDETYNGPAHDGFVLKLNSSGSDLMYSTFLGGGVIGGHQEEIAWGLALASDGGLYVSGYSGQSDFPTTQDAYNNTLGGGMDAFLCKLDSSGRQLVYSTYFGGSTGWDNSAVNGIALDVFDNIYMAGNAGSTDFPTTPGAYDETHNGVVDAFVAKFFIEDSLKFAITSIKDVRNDQGKQILISWKPHQNDTEGARENVITKYAIWRKDDPDLPLVWKVADVPKGDWHFVKEVPALQMHSYNIVAPTLADSTVNNGMYYSTFFISAHTGDPKVHFESTPDSGYSVDNLSPSAVEKVSTVYKESGVIISWEKSAAPDLSHYEIFKGINQNFSPDKSNLVGKTLETFYFDNNLEAGIKFYKVVAYDFSGNYSISNASDIVTRVYETPLEFSVKVPYPNPFNPITTIEYGIPDGISGYVTLKVYDLRGALVTTLVNQAGSPGMYSVVWDGTDISGNKVSSGVYVYTLQAGEFTRSNKMMLMR